jgi:predicted nicotinamide N-methyase|tara:strand:- start:347 stop:517 length:171 start_codon:yes stop_codon:yes gene_type:complete
VVRCAEWPLAVGCASVAGEPAWGWRVWDAAKLLARELEGRDLQGKSVLELGAGTAD